MIKKPAIDLKKLLADVGLELGYNFYFGTRIEIDSMLNAKSLTTAKQAYKYPFVWLVSNYVERISDNYDFYSTVDFTLVFVNVTKLHSDTDKRKAQNIDTVLKPMVLNYMQTLKKTKHYKNIHKTAGQDLTYQMFERALYGSEQGKHVYTDNPTDAIELKMSFRIAISECQST